MWLTDDNCAVIGWLRGPGYRTMVLTSFVEVKIYMEDIAKQAWYNSLSKPCPLSANHPNTLL